jgi:glutathione S-transferase
MRLYHQPRSRSARVLWLLEELGAPFDLTLISREDKQTPDYLRLHPLGRAPVIEEDGGPVFESAAICLHLADLYPEAALIAAPGSHERALHYQWSFFAMTELEAPLVDVARQLWSDDGKPDGDIVDAAHARFHRATTPVEAALEGRDFLVADRFSVADLLVGAVLAFARTAELAELPGGLVPYVDRLAERPARLRANAVKA